MSWQSVSTRKRVVSRTVPLEEKWALKKEVEEMAEAGLCFINNETETTKTFKINYVVEKQEVTIEAIKELFNDSIKPIKLNGGKVEKEFKPTKEKRFLCGEPVMAILNIADFHLNRHISGESSYGDDYDLEKAESVFKNIIDEAKIRLKKNGHCIEKIVLNTCGDFLNSDTPQHTTTKGTLQNDDLNFKQALHKACDLLEYAIYELSTIAPVEYYYVAGNHDETLGYALTLYLSARFRDIPNVTIDISSNSRATIEYGTNVIVIAHGDSEGIRAMDLPFVEPSARKKFSEATNVEILTGHIHSPSVKSKNGIRWETLDSACPVGDEWTYSQGFDTFSSEASILYYNNKYRVQQDFINTKQFL